MTDALQPVNLKRQDKVVLGIITAVTLLLVGGMGYGLYVMLPYLMELAKNTIIFFAELTVLALMALFLAQLWSERELFYYKWKMLARNLRKSLVKEDPIGVLSVVIQRFEARLEKIDEHIHSALGAKMRQDDAIRKVQHQAAEELALAKAAQRVEKSERVVSQHMVASQRWEKAADDMQPRADMFARMKESLERARDLCATQLDDWKNQKQVMAITLEALQDGQRAVKSFKQFFRNNPELEMQELAVDEIERQSNEAEAEIEQFMRVINPSLETADLKKQAEAITAMDKLNTFVDNKRAALTEGAIVTTPIVPPVKIQISR